MGVGEGNPLRSQGIDVGRLTLRMPAEHSNPVVQVVENNKDHVSSPRPPELGMPQPQQRARL